jgi:hypothetical protein
MSTNAGGMEMKRLVGLVFQYDDGSTEIADDARACAKFQSRINSSGILVGMEEFIKQLDSNGKVAC